MKDLVPPISSLPALKYNTVTISLFVTAKSLHKHHSQVGDLWGRRWMLSAQQQSRSTVALCAWLHASREASERSTSVKTFDKKTCSQSFSEIPSGCPEKNGLVSLRRNSQMEFQLSSASRDRLGSIVQIDNS